MKHSKIFNFFNRDNRYLIIPFLLYTPFIFLGYGHDSDSYETLRTGITFIEHGDYVPSRNPGYFVYEMITLLANHIGGSAMTNLVSVSLSLLCLLGVYQFSKTLSIPNPVLVVITLALHPYYWVASTITMDYVVALGLFFLGASMLMGREKATIAGIAFGLAIGSRLMTIILVIFFLVFMLTSRLMAFRTALYTMTLASLLAACFYYLPLDFVGWRWWVIFRPVLGEDLYWTPYLRAGRFIYKNILFFNLPVLIFMLWVILVRKNRRLKLSELHKNFIHSLAWIFVAYEILFYLVPLDPSYLLPVLPFSYMFIGILLRNQRWAFPILILLVLLSNLFEINLARPNVENYATEAKIGLWIEPGYLIESTLKRVSVMGCSDINCYDDRIR